MVVKEARMREVMSVLASVSDPEIPAISVVDLGIVERVEVDGNDVVVTCLPTFVGCPAIDAIRSDIASALTRAGMNAVVNFIYSPAWTSDRITDIGKKKLQEYGLAPPGPSSQTNVKLTLLKPSACPYCGSKNTVLESPFGPTACRATSYCNSCRNPFEQFKPV